jgi:uncharacterized membrane protein YdjX (TVP38/TMEM64 family)
LRDLFQAFLAWGPLGVLLMAVLDSAGIPIPTGVDALLIVLGANHGAVAYWSALLAVAGSTGGNLVLFSLARKGGEAYLHRHTLSPRGRRFRRWFQHYGLLTVFIPALLPIPLPVKIFVISAGALGVPLRTFLIVILSARFPRYFGLTYLGIQMGTYPMRYIRENLFELLLFSAGLFVVLYALIKLKDRARRRREAAAIE